MRSVFSFSRMKFASEGYALIFFHVEKLCEGFSSFFGNEGLCFLMELEIRKDMLTDKIRKAVYAPRVCVRFEAV